MRRIAFFLCGIVFAIDCSIAAPLQQKFDKAAFYAVMKSGDLAAIDNEIGVVKDLPANERDGYAGALLLKKADLQKKAKDKLKYFKEGRIKLETALMADNSNTEFHFLRLTVEEHAPRIVKYRADIEKDKALVIKNFKSLPTAVQHAILDYCSDSKVLHKEDF
ncbi:MAG: hypothetical protein JSU01_08905 [Bacteroidetes bacterium]|nr:hypothetical protein [Bacteroidota bacterium]